MKKKQDDLEKLDGVAMPFWAKALTFIIAAVIAFFLYRWIW